MFFMVLHFWLEATLTASLFVGGTLLLYVAGKLVRSTYSAIRGRSKH